MADISTWQQDDYAELCLRANARRYWPELGFRDPAAQLMLERLGFGGGKGGKHGQRERQALKRSRWFDRRCEQFFARNPEALCIELGAGLSTRFHRLSSQSDWPRFHWLEVDAPDIIQQKSHLLPRIDNYRLMASELTSSDWLMAWQGEPLILLIGHRLMYMRPTDVVNIFRNIAARAEQIAVMTQQPAPVEIVFDYLSPLSFYWQRLLTICHLQAATGLQWGLGTAKYLSNIHPAYSVLSENCLRETSSAGAKWLLRSYQRLTGGCYLEACAAVTFIHYAI
jgi:hypothetical protein